VFELVTADFGAVVVEDHAPGTGGALVDRDRELGGLGHTFSFARPSRRVQSSIMNHMGTQFTEIALAEIGAAALLPPGALAER